MGDRPDYSLLNHTQPSPQLQTESPRQISSVIALLALSMSDPTILQVQPPDHTQPCANSLHGEPLLCHKNLPQVAYLETPNFFVEEGWLNSSGTC